MKRRAAPALTLEDAACLAYEQSTPEGKAKDGVDWTGSLLDHLAKLSNDTGLERYRFELQAASDAELVKALREGGDKLLAKRVTYVRLRKTVRTWTLYPFSSLHRPRLSNIE